METNPTSSETERNIKLESLKGRHMDWRASLGFRGVTLSGDSAVNELTYMVLRVGREVAMMDPKINNHRIGNGGPATMELSNSVFRDHESVCKTAMLTRTFARLGCQQLQLNSLSFDTLLNTRAHPENHKNLIVRIWGWSSYFYE